MLAYHDTQFHRWTVRSVPPEQKALLVNTSMHVTAPVINSNQDTTCDFSNKQSATSI